MQRVLQVMEWCEALSDSSQPHNPTDVGKATCGTGPLPCSVTQALWVRLMPWQVWITGKCKAARCFVEEFLLTLHLV